VASHICYLEGANFRMSRVPTLTVDCIYCIRTVCPTWNVPTDSESLPMPYMVPLPSEVKLSSRQLNDLALARDAASAQRVSLRHFVTLFNSCYHTKSAKTTDFGQEMWRTTRWGSRRPGRYQTNIFPCTSTTVVGFVIKPKLTLG
jgi:hypothetical protein